MTTYFAALLGLTILLYVLLDGFDLGVGIFFGVTRDPDDRGSMLASISPIWDGNETWLVLAATLLWGAFPRAYSLILPAFYLPIVLMLGALILRGVAFEFGAKSRYVVIYRAGRRKLLVAPDVIQQIVARHHFARA